MAILTAMYGTLLFTAGATAQDAGLRIIVLEGEDSVNIIERGTAVPTLVEVRDRNDLPVSGAAVLFLLGDGDTATLNAGLRQVELTTDALGRAAVEVNPVASGPVEFSVSATFEGETATATIAQTNFPTQAAAEAAASAGGAGGGLGAGAVVGIVGGVAAGAVGAVVGLAGDKPGPPRRRPSVPTALTVTAGDGQLVVSWQAASGNGAPIDDYELQYRPEGGSWRGRFVDARSTGATITGLDNGTTYEVRVRAVNSVGAGDWSPIGRGTPVAAASAPTALTVTAGDEQLVVNWQAPADDGAAIESYEVEHRREGGSWERQTSTATTVTITGLDNGTTYEVRVRAVNSVGVGDWSPIGRGTPVAAASAPTALTVTAGDGQLVVSWQAPADDGAAIESYEVEHRREGGSWERQTSTATTVTITGLDNGTTYEVRVRAVNSVGAGDWSPIGRGTPVAAASAPTALTVTAGDGQLVVNWQAPADDGAAIESYEVEHRREGGSWERQTSTATTVTITGLDNGTTYEVRVRAVNSVGVGDWSPIGRGTPVAAASAPTALTVTAGDGQLVVNWQAPADDGAAIESYEVEHRREGGSWERQTSTATTVTITGLDNGTTYEVRVRAVNSVGVGDWSPIGRGTPVAAASAPTALTVTAGDGQLVVSWQAPADDGAAIESYEVEHRREGGSWERQTSTATTVTITGLDNGTTYEVRVRAVNSVGAGDWSPIGRGTPVAAASAPTALTVTAGDGQLVVNWQAPADDGAAIESYEVEHRREGGSWERQTSTATTVTITGLDNGTTYEVRVRAVNSVGVGDWSPIGRGTPVAAASAPTALTVTAGDGQLVVSWQAPADDGAAIDDYDVRYRPSGGVWQELPDDESTATMVTIPDLTNGTTYQVQVRAGNSAGDGEWSDSATGTPVASGDRDALIALYNATDGPNWTNNTNWNSSEPLDQWYGVSTDGNGRVTRLTLGRNRLTGSIPSSLGGLTNLSTLLLNDNALTGSIPPELTSLTNLMNLDLGGNRLTGSIPDALCEFESTINPQQGDVDLSGCSLDGDQAVLVELYNATDGTNWTNNTNWNSSEPLDQWYGVSTDGNGRVTRLTLGRNRLTGSIPSSLGGLTNLSTLLLNDNALTGSIPPELTSLTNLMNLDLGGNRLTGSIPDALCEFESTINPQQGDVDLSGCSLDGDQAVLVELYNATDGTNWTNNTNWNSSEPLDQWYGVSTDGNGRVTRLTLGRNRLTGSIPSSLGGLTNLLTLLLNDNALTGSIPSSLGGLTNLRVLRLYGNALTGPIPSSLGGLTNLGDLRLNDNALTGLIPPSLGGLTNLRALHLYNNALTGLIPPSLGGLTNLEILRLDNNALTGSIPSSLGGLTNLEILRLHNNELTGLIPPELTSLTNLTNLYLGGNRLTEPIPDALCEFESTINPQQGDVDLSGCGADSDDRAVLVELYNSTDGPNWTKKTNWDSSEPLGKWQGVTTDQDGRVTRLELQDANMRGPIPSSLGNLTNLTHLNLSYNGFDSISSSAFVGLTNLTYLDLSGTLLTGSIPGSLGSLTNLTHLELSLNDFRGPIPSSFGSLTNLTHLALYRNEGLIGSISVLGGLRNLTHLDLGTNNFTGQIPSSFGSFMNLTYLNLSINDLVGRIPSSFVNLESLTTLSLRFNKLTGEIPAALCGFEDTINPQVLPQSNTQTHDLPCEGNGNLDLLEAQLVPGDGQLEVHWTAPSVDVAPVDGYDVRYRIDTEFGSWTELPDITKSTATSRTITGLTNGTLYQVQVRAGHVEGDDAWSASATGTPDVPAERLSFGDARVEDQRYRQHAAIAPLELPAATGGVGAVTYALAPALPVGLAFDAASRTISGTPSVASAPVTYTYTASDASAAVPYQVSLSFAIEVEVSAEEAALRRDALAAQGRALLSSVTGVIGERFRSRPGPAGVGTQGSAGTEGAAGALGEALASMVGSRAGWEYGGAAGGAALTSGQRPHGHPGPNAGGLVGVAAAGSAAGWGGPSAVGSAGEWEGLSGIDAGGLDGAMPASWTGASEVGAGGWDNLVWGRSFAAPLAGGEDGGGVSRYTVWGAGDLQSFSGTPEAGRYSGDVRSLYVGADGRLGADWLAGAAVGSSWGAADYAAASGGGAEGRLTTRLTSLYPYVRGNVSSGLEVWAIGGYGWGEARDARGAEAPGAAGDLTMTMGAAGLRQDVLERGGVALAVVGGGGSLSLSTAGGGLTVAGLAARVHQARLAVEASRASRAVSPFVQLGMRYDGGDGQTGAGLEVVAGLRASTSRLDLEARGRWLSVHSAAGYGEYGAAARLAVKSRPDGTGLRAALAPRWGAAESGGFGQDGLLGGAGASRLRPGAAWSPGAQALSLDTELGYGWRTRRLRGVLSPMTSYSRSGYGGDLTRVGLSFLSAEAARQGNLKMQFTLGREQWRERGAAYQLALLVSSTF